MLTHGRVVKALEQIIGTKVEAIADASSSLDIEIPGITPYVLESSTPGYWQFFLTARGSDIANFVGTLYNENCKYTPVRDFTGTVYALVEKANPKTCSVPQKEIDLLIPALQELSGGKVYWADDAYKKKNSSSLTPLP